MIAELLQLHWSNPFSKTAQQCKLQQHHWTWVSKLQYDSIASNTNNNNNNDRLTAFDPGQTG